MSGKIIILFITLIVLILPFVYKLPIPADTIPGLYYPMKDLSFEYANGVPVKNPLITDPVRQQFVWKYLAISEMKKGNWPLWNPYNMSGTPLLANIQSGVFYPLNIIFFMPNFLNLDNLQFFAITWSWFIYLQIPLSIFFLYLYLRKIGLSELASLFGGCVWAFSGFTTGWWEWGNVVHTLLYFPLILWCIENIIQREPIQVKGRVAIEKSLIHPFISMNRYKLILIAALSASFFAGHLQTFLFIITNTIFYVLYKIPLVMLKNKKPYVEMTKRRLYYWFQLTQVTIIFLMIIAIQLIPAIDFIGKSARNIDTDAWQRKDWFYPTEHFISLIAPDYFGNPTTYNYWGVWNYGEFASYIGIIPLIFAVAIIFQFLHDQVHKLVPSMSFRLSHKEVSAETLDILQENAGVGFFLIALSINLLLITKNFFTTTLYALNIPFFTTTQPSRGIAIVIFALVVLSAVGFHKMLRIIRAQVSTTSFISIKTNCNFSYIVIAIVIALTWFNILTKQNWFLTVLEKTPDYDVFKIARSNMILPTIFFIIAFLGIRFYFKKLEQEYVKKSAKIAARSAYVIIGMLLTFTAIDLGRFFLKFESFSHPRYLYPQTEVTKKLQQDPTAKFMTEDSRIMPPNMNIPYQLKSVEGYDPLYLNQYGKFIGLWQRNEPNLEPFNANRILTPHTPKSVIADIAAAKYLIALGEYTKYEKVADSGMTKLYLRDTAVPRATIFPVMRGFATEQDMVNYMFSPQFDARSEGLYMKPAPKDMTIPANGIATLLGNKNNTVIIKKDEPTTVQIQANLNDAPGLLYLADTFDDGWTALVNGEPATIIKTNLTFRGIRLPQGENEVIFRYTPKLFDIGKNITIFGIAITVFITLTSIQRKATGI